MQKEITVEELEKIDNIEEPVIIKRKNKRDLIVLDLEEYKKAMFMNNLSGKLDESEKQYNEGKVQKAEKIFRELRSKYGC